MGDEALQVAAKAQYEHFLAKCGGGPGATITYAICNLISAREAVANAWGGYNLVEEAQKQLTESINTVLSKTV